MAISITFTDFVALVSLSLPSHQNRRIQVRVDTGFTGELALPRALIEELQLKYIYDQEVSTANSKKVGVPVYNLDIDWFGETRKVEVFGMQMNLLGMRLLDNRLTQIEMRSNPKTITIQ